MSFFIKKCFSCDACSIATKLAAQCACMWMHWTFQNRNKTISTLHNCKMCHEHKICCLSRRLVCFCFVGRRLSGESDPLNRYPGRSLSADVADLLTWWKASCITLGNENSDHISRVTSSFLKRDEKKRENIITEDNLWRFNYWCYRSSFVGIFFSRSLVYFQGEGMKKKKESKASN